MSLKIAWQLIKLKVISYLRGEFVKLALKKILGTAVKTAGFKAWLVTFIAKELYDELAEPLIHFVFNEAEYQANVVNGKLIVKKLDQARGEGDEDSYDSTTDDIFN